MKYKLYNNLRIFVILITLSCLMPTMAAAEEIIKIGYFDIGDYYKLDENSEIDSYDTDYLREVSKYTDLDFEFVYCGTWINAVNMLKNKQIDLVGTTQWTEARSNEYEFCNEKYGYAIGQLVVLPNKNVIYEDYDVIGKMKIGCLVNYVQRKALDKCLDSHSIAPEIILFNTQRELEKAFNDGIVDAIAVNSHSVSNEWTVIEKFSYAPYYFITWKGNNQLTDKIDRALIQINIENPDFDDILLGKRFPEINNNSLTKEEREYIESIGSLTFGFCTNEGYLCRTENGEYVGIHPAIARRVCELLGVEYREAQFDFPKLIKSLSGISRGNQQPDELLDKIKSLGIDVWGDVYSDKKWANTLGIGMTNQYLEATYYEIKKRGAKINRSECKVAAVRGLRYTSDIVNGYNDEQIVWCDDFEACIRAVKAGKADITVINTLAAEYYLSMFQYNDLSATLIPLKNYSSMAIINDKNGLLTSAINKTLMNISDKEKTALIRNETAKPAQQNLLMVYFYTHTKIAVLIIISVVIGVVMLIVMFYNVKKSRRQNELLLQATNAKSDFLAKMSHDIRTPMNAIINLTKMVEEEIDDKNAALRDIKKIKTSNEFLLSLINDVLDMSRIEHGKLKLKAEEYSDDEFIDYMHSTFDSLCDSKKIVFSIESEKCIKLWLTDIVRFNQIFFNLVSNAVKYTPNGGMVTLSLKYGMEIDGYIPMDIYVIDNGIGMKQEFVEHAFESFEQENRQFMSVEGTGLGLSIVKEIVNLMDGNVNIKSEIDKGTIVHVRLNMKVTADTATGKKAAGSSEKEFSILKGKQVLLVEDHPLNRQIAVRLLEKAGLNVLTAVDGAEGVNMFAVNCSTLSAILMDIRMPVMNGLESAENIRRLECAGAKDIPIIAMTANAYDEDVQKSMAAGMNEHLTKPVNTKILYNVLEKCIDEYEKKSGGSKKS